MSVGDIPDDATTPVRIGIGRTLSRKGDRGGPNARIPGFSPAESGTCHLQVEDGDDGRYRVGIEAVRGLTVRTVGARGDAGLTLPTTASDDCAARLNPPGETRAGVGVVSTRAGGWDDHGGPETGGRGFATVLHEFGHGPGMAHPHGTGGGSTVRTGVCGSFDSAGAQDLNQGLLTTMTCSFGAPEVPGLRENTASLANQATMMAFDIAPLQRTYGANPDHRGGDDVHQIAQANRQGAFLGCIRDTGGTGTIRLDGSAAATIDLRAATLVHGDGDGGYRSLAEGIASGFTIAHGVMVENAVGGAGADGFACGSVRASFGRFAASEREGDAIPGFVPGEDVIDLSAIDARHSGGGDQAFRFIGDRGFRGQEGILRTRFDGEDTWREGDPCGEGAPGLRIRLSGAVSLDASDVILQGTRP